MQILWLFYFSFTIILSGHSGQVICLSEVGDNLQKQMQGLKGNVTTRNAMSMCKIFFRVIFHEIKEKSKRKLCFQHNIESIWGGSQFGKEMRGFSMILNIFYSVYNGMKYFFLNHTVKWTHFSYGWWLVDLLSYIVSSLFNLQT